MEDYDDVKVIWTDNHVGRMTEDLCTNGERDLADHMRSGNGDTYVSWSSARSVGYNTEEIASMAADGFTVSDGA